MVRDGAHGCSIAHSHSCDTQMLEFCRDTRQDLSDFEADGVSRLHHTRVTTLYIPTHSRLGRPS
jgi:hypothetical protein